MTIARLICISVVLIVVLAVADAGRSLAAGHPASGHEVADVFDSFYNMDLIWPPPEWSTGDITFFLSDRPSPETLTQEEKYIVAGVRTSSLPSGLGLAPWYMGICSIAEKFYNAYGYLPEVLTSEVMRTIPRWEERSESWLDIFRSPLTGEWPALNAASHSPGDIYMRPLTQYEMRHFADLYPGYQHTWFESKRLDFSTGKYTQDIRPVTDVFYVRVYGWNGTLVEHFSYVMHDV
ncbi:hypothetical protein IIA79_03800 [bacterium]|nr:hypothetical protein [bacterium]